MCIWRIQTYCGFEIEFVKTVELFCQKNIKYVVCQLITVDDTKELFVLILG